MSSTERNGVRYFGCCLCGDIFEGYGNNPAPLVTPPDDDTEWDEECCDNCNATKVIPARMKEMGL
jgi:hypothetical protein